MEKVLKKQIKKTKKTLFQLCQDLTTENNILKRALDLAVNALQREIDGDGVGISEIVLIYEVGKYYYINKAKESLKIGK